MLRLARELFIKEEARRVVKVRRVAIGTADRKGKIDSPLMAAVAIMARKVKDAEAISRVMVGLAWHIFLLTIATGENLVRESVTQKQSGH